MTLDHTIDMDAATLNAVAFTLREIAEEWDAPAIESMDWTARRILDQIIILACELEERAIDETEMF